MKPKIWVKVILIDLHIPQGEQLPQIPFFHSFGPLGPCPSPLPHPPPSPHPSPDPFPDASPFPIVKSQMASQLSQPGTICNIRIRYPIVANVNKP